MIRVHPEKAARRPHVPEEGRAFDYASALLKGDRDLSALYVSMHGKRQITESHNALGAPYDVVLIRDDGWTLGASKKWLSAAEDTHRGSWIGRLEFSKTQKWGVKRREHAKIGLRPALTVISQQGIEYKAGELDMEGNVTKSSRDEDEPPPVEGDDGAPSGGRSLEQLRSWMAAGCPEGEE